MVSPERKRQAALHLQECCCASELRACRVVSQPRATQRYRGCRRDKDAPLVAALRRVSASRQRKLRRLGGSENSAQRRRTTRINEVWSYDFVYDQTEDGRRLKWLPICDEFSRESVALEVERRMESGDVIRILDAAVLERGTPPDFIRSDNGSEFIARAVQDWIGERGFKTLYIAPGSPWENPYSESFNSRFRDEFLNRESFCSLLEAKVLGKEHRKDYNHSRLHSSLDYQTPAEFAQRCFAAPNHQPNPNHKTNQISHSKWFKVRGHAKGKFRCVSPESFLLFPFTSIQSIPINLSL
ncbi:MAG: IS3 family transposase [Chthoniobacteraceae bacterium]